ERDSVRPVSITDEMKRSYLDYAMSVIVSRALPDARDGLKPVHRRIFYSMHKMGYDWNKPHRKSARVVGDVIGKYHPHSEQAIYDALVRMTQDFSLRLPLLDGQGNFGSIDADSAAAMRYTEVRLAKPAHALLEDLDKNTVDFKDNYDGSEKEPMVLPSRFPNLLANGASGIAVGMATSIPPHNLGEIIAGCILCIDRPDIGIDELLEVIPGPDFPTGGIIMGRFGILSAFRTGRGSVIVRSRVAIEPIRGKEREALIITEIPYQVNKAAMVEKIAELVNTKRIEGISDVRDESNREGLRVVIEIKRDAVSEVVLNQLYQLSQLQTSFHCNMVALNGGKPELMNLKDLLSTFLIFREEVVARRIKYLLIKARERAHTFVGLAIAVANIDEIIKLIRIASDASSARRSLTERSWPVKDMRPMIVLIADPEGNLSESEDGDVYHLSEKQARAILELRLERLTGLGRDEISRELKKLGAQISEYLGILSSREHILDIVRQELLHLRDEFATPRRTEIVDYEGDVEDEDLIQRENMVVTVSHLGYIKRVPFATYRAQRRGGKGRRSMTTREEDFVTRLFVASTHTPILFFSSRGIVYKIKVWRLPESTPQARGKAMVNLLPIKEAEKIATIMPMPEDEATCNDLYVMFSTLGGSVRRNRLSDFLQINRSGKIAMKLDEGDGIVGVRICTENDDVLLTTTKGRCVRFPVSDVRIFVGRTSTGVRGIRLSLEDDHVASIAILHHVNLKSSERIAYLKYATHSGDRGTISGAEDDIELDDEEDTGEGSDKNVVLSEERYEELRSVEQFILTVSENGYGKRTSSFEYRTTARGGKGLIAMSVNERNGKLIASFPVEKEDQIMLLSNSGQLIRCPVCDIRIAGRVTQGVILFDMAEDEHVVSVEHIPGENIIDKDDPREETSTE
ncbi:MAG: DNA gyrase subunit A, partial [Alphaproteobacteria bacterium]|nr:DNA gyrase subunit A [Alphaproteobacteria bacterium]